MERLIKVGDLVVAREDERRGIFCCGVVLDLDGQTTDESGIEAFVMWYTDSYTTGWWSTRTIRALDDER